MARQPLPSMRLSRLRSGAARADGGDAAVVDDDVAARVLGAGVVDRRDRAVLDDRVMTRPAGRRRGSSRSPCSGRGCRRAPRGSRGRTGSGLRASRSCVATIRPGVQNPHWTAPACRNASWIGCSSSSDGARPSTVTISRPSAWPASDEARADELAVEVDRAAAALALLAGVLGAGQREPLAQHVQQALALPDAVDLARLAVDRAGQPHADHAHFSVRRASTDSACLR